ncbi:serine/threonine-protein phosphatase 6 regulatory ankyrin repeat subunit C-like [Penaeus monodon]|uniref:serine/threonine-protein phosphatase 6 regulatory ankyrin repeat subunit C-like n=1 Tax=Penaeus monodon TaxID=6687 RepID=UPI0018A7AB6B|nr:serine/threonine-protein phosphatase 6 regulatory ankyrin repeat subunit C-like [Penaeus monodon]
MGGIHEAAKGGRAGYVLRSLEDGEDPSASTISNNTPLHYAAYEGHTDVLRILLDKKSDPKRANDSGDTPLHLAAINGKTDVKMFPEEEGNTSLHCASLAGHTVVKQTLKVKRLSITHLCIMLLSEILLSAHVTRKISGEDTALIRGHVHTAWWLKKMHVKLLYKIIKILLSLLLERISGALLYYTMQSKECE